MKKAVIFNKVVLSAAMLFAVASCQKQESNTLEPTTQAVEFSAGVNTSAVDSKATALRNSSFVDGDKIGVYAAAYYDANTQVTLIEKGNYSDNVCFTAIGTSSAANSWSANPAIYYPQHKVDFYAYTPYNEDFLMTNASAFQFTIPADQSTETSVRSADFMTAQTLGCSIDDAPQRVDLLFHHRFAKLDIHFQIPTEYRTGKFSNVTSVTVRNAKNQATVDMTSKYSYFSNGTLDVTGKDVNAYFPAPASVTAESTLVDITPYCVQTGAATSLDMASDATKTKYELILAPQTFTASHNFIEIEIQYLNSADTEKFTFLLSEGLTFKAGENTQITLAISDFGDGSTNTTEIKPGSIAIIGWTSAESLEGSTQKMHNMIFDIDPSAADISKEGSFATIKIQGITYNAIAKYDENTNQYRLQYDPEESFGGELQELLIRNDNGTNIFGETIDGSFSIKGDPSLDDYDRVVATIKKAGSTFYMEAGGLE